MSIPTAQRTCPGCNSAMQIFHASRVELDLCPECGGVWLDRNAVETVAGRMLNEMPRESTTLRHCAVCRELLTPMMLEGEQVECCTSCRGVYLDKGELDQLAMSRVPLQGPALTHAHDGTVLTFQCPGCEGEFPSAQGLPWGRGLVCEECAPRFGVRKPSPDDGKGVGWVAGTVLEILVALIP